VPMCGSRRSTGKRPSWRQRHRGRQGSSDRPGP